MKLTYILWFVLLLSTASSSDAIDTTQVNGVWPASSLPHTFYIDSSVLPTVEQNPAYTDILINEAHKWNTHLSLGPLLNVVKRDFTGWDNNHAIRRTNGIDEISFDSWDPNYTNRALAYAAPRYTTPCVQTPRLDCKRQIREMSIMFNPFIRWFIGNIPNNCNSFNVASTLKHELGHALGMKHFGNTLMKGGSGRKCEKFRDVTGKEFEALKYMYPNWDSVDVNVSAPTLNQILVINQAFVFSASIIPLLNKSGDKLNAQEIKALENQLVWSSSVDGEIATGNNVYVDLSELSSGQHELTVTIGQPGDQVYGDGTSSFFILDEVITDYTDRLHPFPCPRIIGSNNNSCLMSVEFEATISNDFCPWWSADQDVVAHDMLGTLDFNRWNELFVDSDAVPRCGFGDGFPEYHSWKVYSWLTSDDDNTVDFRMHSFIKTNYFGETGSRETIEQRVPLVNAEIDLLPIETCSVNDSSDKCSVTLRWKDLFFAPDAGIYYRKLGTNYWYFLKRISATNGSYSTENIVDTQGIEFMVFQFSRDIYTRDSIYNSNLKKLIDAPRGRMVEPILVKAIDTSVPDNTPTLDSVAVIGETTYKVELLGEKFGVSTSVIVRENVNGSQPLAVYSSEMFHNSGTHVSSHAHAGKDFIRFPVIKTSRQSIFRNSGLCFKVLSDSLESSEVCYTMPPRNPQPDFAGGSVQSYNHRNSTQDIDIDAFVTKSNGNSLKLWGNSWKKVPMSYSVTPNTELNINFKSTLGEVEIAGVGFILQGQTQLASSKFWQFHGTQNWGIPDHNNYSGTGDKSYTIKVGEQFTGQISHMVFVADHDNQDVAQNVVFQTPTLVENIPGVDAYDDVPAQRAFDDDEKGRAVNWTGGTAGHEHTFHDAGDVDWTIVHTNEFRARTELIGSGADTKLSVYRWISADPNQSLGYYENVVDEFVGKSDTVGASEYSVYGSENYIYAIKVESRNNVLGENSKYRLILDPTPPFRPDEYDDVPARRGFNDDVKGQAVLWTGETSGFHQHNFHDAGDVDWTIIYAEDFKVRAETLGANASTKMTLYKWVSATPNSNLGYYVNVNDQLISQDHSGGDTALLHFSNQANIYAVKIESKNGAFGPGTEYQLAFSAIQNTSPDGNENKAGVSGYTDDFEGTPASWNSGDTLHMHNFHDNGDIDWTLVYANNFTAHADAIGQDADLKMTIYQWTDYDVVGGIYRNIVKQQVGYDGNGGDGLVSIQRNEPAVYAIKIEPKNGAYGSTTNYSLRLY